MDANEPGLRDDDIVDRSMPAPKARKADPDYHRSVMSLVAV